MSYRLVVNEKDVTQRIAPYLTSLRITDNEKNESDELSLTLTAPFERPAYQDKIKVFVKGRFIGLFYVQKTTLRNNQELTITGTGIDFSRELKERRHQRYEQTTLTNLAKLIAKRHGLQVISDLNQPTLDVDQVNESDLHLLNRLAKEHACLFNIKNATLYLTRRAIAPPAITINLNQCTQSAITHSTTTHYKSCKAIYQDTRRNQYVAVIVGEGKPELAKQGQFQNDEEAKRFAQNALARANQGTIEGSLTLPGQVCFAGGRLTLEGEYTITRAEYTITRAEHTLDSNGWLTSLEFNNKDA